MSSSVKHRNHKRHHSSIDLDEELITVTKYRAYETRKIHRSSRSSFNPKFSPSDCIIPSVKKRKEITNTEKDLGKTGQKEYQSIKSFSLLTPCQRRVADSVLRDGKSVFFTGAAGTGKSFLLRFMIEVLIAKYGKRAVAITASTGLAAININGDTLHSYVGVRTFNPNDAIQVGKNLKKQLIERWRATKILIIDEISMIDGHYFSNINLLAKKIKGNDLPFGGIQLIITGDFFQLPPVPDEDRTPPIPCFQSSCWDAAIQETFVLNEIFRQRDDPQLKKILSHLRVGELSEKDIKVLKNLQRPLQVIDGIWPTELLATRAGVDAANLKRLEQLSGEYWEFAALDSGSEKYIGKLNNLLVPEKLILKINSQVMALTNRRCGISNGSMGVVKFFVSKSCWIALKSEFSREEIDSEGFVKCALSLKELLNDRKDDFKTEVTANRLKEEEGALAIRFINAVRSGLPKGHFYPVVKFFQGSKSRTELMTPETFIVDSSIMKQPVSRRQVPLMLSWAISIHKSQGQTLNRVRIDLSQVFEKGQLYAALSRAVSTRDLQVVGYDPSKALGPSQQVKDFYNTLKVLR